LAQSDEDDRPINDQPLPPLISTAKYRMMAAIANIARGGE
jgi:hypothetical protein